ncbi:hypothetical protein C3E98_006875 [Pseudomonas sp. MWU13-2625]|nr:hypothetical protein C3E98_006875 [Pseudomonas sp. MWU13-2625]
MARALAPAGVQSGPKNSGLSIFASAAHWSGSKLPRHRVSTVLRPAVFPAAPWYRPRPWCGPHPAR